MIRAAWVALGLAAVSAAQAGTETIYWFNTVPDVDPVLAPAGLPGSLSDPGIGAMVQLISCGSDGVASSPTTGSLATAGSGVPAGSDDVVVFTSWMGRGAGEEGASYHADAASLTSLGVVPTDRLYIRVHARPSAGNGNVPAPSSFGGLSPNQPQGGWYYSDSPVSLVSTLPTPGAGSGIYEIAYDITSSVQWTFVPAAGLTGLLDITNVNQSVGHTVSNITLGGVASNVVGLMRWTNSLTGLEGTVAAAGAWSLGPLYLGVGANMIVVRGSNAAGVVASDTVTITRVAGPLLDITTASATVRYSVVVHPVAGTSTGLTGQIGWTNSLTSSGGTMPAAGSFIFTNVSLAVGTNVVMVLGTNAFGDWAWDSVTIVRGGLGTDLPAVDITNANGSVANAVSNLVIGGTANAHVVGTMRWTNSLGGSWTFAATGTWSTMVSLAVGTNTIMVTGTNQLGESAADAVAVIRAAVSGPTNHAPYWTSTPVTSATVGVRYEYVLGAADADGDTVSFSVLGLPAWLSLVVTNESGPIGGSDRVTTVAGTGATGSTGDGGPATNATFNVPYHVAADLQGRIYVSEHMGHRIRRIETNGTVRTFAGTGANGYSGNGGPATNAAVSYPLGLVAGADGVLWICDYENDRVRKVDTNGTIRLVAGTGSTTYNGDGLPATNANLYLPDAIAVDDAGQVYFTELYHHRLRKVTAGGLIHTVAGTGTAGYNGDGIAATNAQVNHPYGLARDGAGRLYFSDYSGHRVRRVDTNGIITTVAGTGVAGYSGDGGSATNARVNGPCDLRFDAWGNLFIADSANAVVRRVGANGIITTIAGRGTAGFSGDGGAATNAEFRNIYGLSFDPAGRLLVADVQNVRIRRIEGGASAVVKLTGTPGPGDAGITNITLLAGDGRTNTPQSFTLRVGGANGAPVWVSVPTTHATAGRRYVYPLAATDPDADPLSFYGVGLPPWLLVERGSGEVRGSNLITTVVGNGSGVFSGDGGSATNAGIRYPHGVTVDEAGVIYLSDQGNQRVRAVATNGIIRTLAGTGSTAYNGNAIAATNAGLNNPMGLAADAGGNLYVAILGHHLVRKITPAGLIVTVAGTGAAGFGGDGGSATNAALSSPVDVALDGAGNLYIADAQNSRIRKVGTNGLITTVAGNGGWGFAGDGGPATNATLNRPHGIDVDRQGRLFISDQYGHRVRTVGTDGIIRTVAGNGSGGYNGDNIAATNASLKYPYDTAVDDEGNLYIADDENDRVRKVGTNGLITTVVGRGIRSYGGDGGAATNARISFPAHLAMDRSGNLLLADYGNHRIRRIAGESGGWRLTGTPGLGDAGSTGITLVVTDGPHPVPQVFTLTVAGLRPPTNLIATANGPGRIQLTWADNNADETGYVVERRTASNAVWVVIASLPANSAGLLDSGLADGQAYSYRVSAANVDGLTAPSAVATATTLRVPTAPSGLTATATATNRIGLAWTDASDNEDGFELQRRMGTVGSWSALAAFPAGTSSHQDAGLQANTLYFYRLRSTNAAGASAFGAEAGATTPPATNDTDCGYLLLVTATNLVLDGVSNTLPTTVTESALVDGSLVCQQTSPRGAGSVQRVVMGFRDSLGRAAAPAREVSLLYGTPGCPGRTGVTVPVPAGLRAPTNSGVFSLWIEAFVSAADPRLHFVSQVRTGATALARSVGQVTVQPRAVGQVEVRLLPGDGLAGQPVSVPVLISSTGGESAISFSLTYDPAVITQPRIQAGADAPALWVAVNTSAVGRVGCTMMMPGDEMLAGGTKRVADLVFQAVGTGISALAFADLPVARGVALLDPDAIPVVSWVGSTVTIRAPGYEADLAPRPGGDSLVTESDRLLVQLLVSGLDVPASSNEFRKADCSPRFSSGDGVINVFDLRQAYRYMLGYDALQPAGGPWGPTNAAVPNAAWSSLRLNGARAVSLPDITTNRGDIVWIPVQVDAQGDESALAFSLDYDPELLTYLELRALGPATNALVAPAVQGAEVGLVGLALALPANQVMPAGLHTVAEIAFASAAGGSSVTTTVFVGDDPMPRGVSGTDAQELAASFAPDAVVTLHVAAEAPGAPAAPGALTAVAVSTNQVNLAWTDVATGEDGYRILRRQGAESWAEVVRLPAGAEAYADIGLPVFTLCRYVVEAFNGSGSNLSAEASARTWAPMDAWRQVRFGTPVAAGNTADDADWDYDGLPNLLEYALGLDPTVEDYTLLPFNWRIRDGVTIGTNTFLTAEYDLLSGAAAEMKIRMQIGTAMPGEWGIDMLPVDEVATNGVLRHRVRSDQPLGARGQEFLRMLVEPQAAP